MSHFTFDPSAVGKINAGLFGFGYLPSESELVVLPVPWDVTTSYRSGTSKGPLAILEASPQLDFFDPDYPNLWEFRVAMADISVHWKQKNDDLRPLADEIIHAIESGELLTQPQQSHLIQINQACADLHQWCQTEALKYIQNGQFALVLGGEHSVAFGNISACHHHHGTFGILQIDAHQDLRDRYLGFDYSHASVMRRVLDKNLASYLVQVGIRDCSPDEMAFAHSDARVNVFDNKSIQTQQFLGHNWDQVCSSIIDALPKRIYLSIDIDGLQPVYCPHTGTPVPGGLSFDQLSYLLARLARSDKQLVGADLVEVAPGPDEWDANVGARLLWQLAGVVRQIGIYSTNRFKIV